MIIALGADHGGFPLKQSVIEAISSTNNRVLDLGTFDENPVDYPDYAKSVAEAVVSVRSHRGILLCGSGVGACVTANKVKGIRAVDAADVPIAIQSREHINTNILCLGQNYISVDLAKKIVRNWLSTPFSTEERHRRRVGQIDSI